MNVLRLTKNRPPVPDDQPAPTTDPLTRLLQQAARKAEDSAIRSWLCGLLRGEAAGGDGPAGVKS